MIAKLERVAERPTHRKVDLNAWAMAGVLAAMWALLALLPATRGMFLTQGNIANLLSQYSVLLVVAVGMTFVILIRGIDLSVGAGVALTGVVAALAQQELGLPAPWAIAITLAAGAAIGVWHGFWVAWLGIPAFIVTLAGFKAYRGAALVASNATGMQMADDFSFLNGTIPVSITWIFVVGLLAIGLVAVYHEARRREELGLPALTTATVAIRMAGQVLLSAAFLAVFGEGGVPVPVFIAGAVALGGMFALRHTRLGREVYAIGGNPEAARLSGVAVKRVTLIVYTIMGVLTALGGLLAAARVNGVTAANQGNLLELDAVTAVVIGGTSIAGGRGSVVGTVLGTLVFATLANGMSLLGIDSNWQLIFTGLILMLAVLIDVMLKARKSPKIVLLVFALPAIPLIALAAAGGSKTTTTTVEKPAVAFLLSTLQEERYLKDVKFFEERAKQHGMPSVTFAADNDNAKQLAQVEDAITLGAKVLVIQPTDSKAAAAYVELAKKHGVSVIAYDRSIQSTKLDYYVSHDSYRVGVLQAEAAIRATGGKGNYVILSGQAGHSVATEITRGYTETLARHPGIQIVMQQSHSAWASEQALRTVEDAITRSGGKLDAILANNSGMARGAVQAVVTAKLANVFIAGADADAANLMFVCEGKQTIEVLKDIEPLATTAADVAKAILDGKPPTDKMVAVRVEVIAKDAACKSGGAK